MNKICLLAALCLNIEVNALPDHYDPITPELLNNTTASVLHKLLESSDKEPDKKVVRRAMRSFNKTAKPSSNTRSAPSKNVILPQLYVFDETGQPVMVNPNATQLFWNGMSYSIGSWRQ